ncbi:MAG TPA: type II toxin-antitoxin system RelE/ParE family toxin [bacterium]|nr:type II toxin-antitoxin system RelE/ParE family toxin [bacterium]HQL63009.1 type II toxin-antitoxin system RelE/ParE family toxin [bacterium]
MKRVFIETRGFTQAVANFLSDEDYAEFQRELMRGPRRGTVMRGCGGLRKVRLPNPRKQKGKKGGARIIYLDVPEAKWTLLLDIYGKEEKDDLKAAEKKVLKRLTTEFKNLAKQTVKEDDSS